MSGPPKTTKLTSTQRELLKLIALDNTATEAGALLGLSSDAARWHSREAKRKLRTKTLTRAVLKFMINT